MVRGNKGWDQTDESFWKHVGLNTEKVLGKKEVGIFMTYFPVVIHTRHLAEMREFIKNRLGYSTFDYAFESMSSSHFSVHNILMNYLFHFQRDAYSWHVYTNEADYEEYVDFGLTEAEQQPTVHVSTHWKYSMP